MSDCHGSVPGVVTSTERGTAALDKLAATLAAECDGSPTSIADLLEHVLETDIEDLAEAINETPGRSRGTQLRHRPLTPLRPYTSLHKAARWSRCTFATPSKAIPCAGHRTATASSSARLTKLRSPGRSAGTVLTDQAE